MHPADVPAPRVSQETGCTIRICPQRIHFHSTPHEGPPSLDSHQWWLASSRPYADRVATTRSRTNLPRPPTAPRHCSIASAHHATERPDPSEKTHADARSRSRLPPASSWQFVAAPPAADWVAD